MAEDHLNEEEIFKVAVQIDTQEAREVYLKQICGHDQELLNRVQTLLRIDGLESGFLEQPIADLKQEITMVPISEQEGAQIGPYKLLQKIGEGGFGAVYMAEQTKPVNRKVALKIIKPGMDTKEVIARFEAERQALALMDHPNIAKVLDAGETESAHPYFVMELVKGVPLTEYCDKNHLPTRERLNLFIDVCHAIQHAHQKGVIHRDLKPSNVMVTLHDGRPVAKVIDFGVSKALSQRLTERTLFTAYGQMVGTPAYMSPEQAEMSGLDIDTRSDVYSLGVLLYELLTGTTPFDGKRLRTVGYVEMQRIIREEEPPKPSTRLTALGDSSTIVSSNRGTDSKHLSQLLRGELDWIVMKAMEKDRNRRYETANGFAADVQRYLKDEAVIACPPTAAYRFRKFARRYKTQVSVAAGFTTLLLLSSVIAWWLYADARVARDEVTVERDRAVDAEQTAEQNLRTAQQERDRAESEKQRADLAANELKLRLYNYNLIKAKSAYERDEIGQTLTLLEDCLPEQRRWEWHRINRLAGSRRTFKLRKFAISAVSSTEPRIVVFDDETGLYHLYDLDTAEELISGKTGLHSHTFATFSPSGDLVVVTSIEVTDRHPTTSLQVWEVATGRKVWETHRKNEMAPMAFFSPDGRSLVFSGIESKTGHGNVQLFDIEDWKLIWQHSPNENRLPIATFSPDGQRLYVTVNEPPPGKATLYCWNIDGPQEVWAVSDISACIPCPTPDGSQIVTGGPNHVLRIRSSATGELIDEFTGSGPDVSVNFIFSPDGKSLVSEGHLGQRLVWNWEEKEVVNSLPARESALERISFPGFTHDSQQIISTIATDTVEIRDIHPAPAELVLSGHEQSVKRVAFSLDGQHVASVSRDGTLRSWSTETGQEQRTIRAHPSAFDLAFAPDGRSIATGGSDGIKLWSTDTGRRIHHWQDAGSTWWLDFSPNGQWVMSGAAQKNGQGLVSLFDVTSRQKSFTRELTRWIDGIVICADGRHAVSVLHQSGQIDIWNLESGEVATIRSGVPAVEYMRCLVSNPRKNQVALVIDDTIEIWDIDQRQLVDTMHVDGESPYCLAFDHDGSRLFSGDTGGFVKVWDLDTNELIYAMPAHDSVNDPTEKRALGVNSLAISPDGKTLATAGADGLIKLWETTWPEQRVADQRQIVWEATLAVNEKYRAAPNYRDVIDSLTADGSLSQDVLRIATEIANARGDRPLGPMQPSSEKRNKQVVLTSDDVHRDFKTARQTFAEFIQAESKADFDKVDVNSPEETDAGWIWAAAYDIVPNFSALELDLLINPYIEQYPEAHQFVCLRGMAHGQQGRWQAARADLNDAMLRVPEKTNLRQTYAYLLSFLDHRLGNTASYQLLCEQAFVDYRESLDVTLAERAAKMSMFAKSNGGLLVEAIEAASFAMESAPHDNYRWISLSLGIAEYRRGNWELAIEILKHAGGPLGRQRPSRAATAKLFQALAHKQLRHHEHAERLKSEAEKVLRHPDFGKLDWWDSYIAEVAHRELLELSATINLDPIDDQEATHSSQVMSQRIITPDSEWKWLHPSDGIDPATADPDFHQMFFATDFDDATWQTGLDQPGAEGGFGYGDAVGNEFEVPAEGDRKSAYLRHRFTTEQAFDDLILSLQLDDGMIVYLDGKEVQRINVGNGQETYDLMAVKAGSTDQETWVGFYRLSASLEPGEHLLSISLHNNSDTNSDLRIAEISLWGTPKVSD